MVNENVLRKPIVQNVDHIEVLLKDNINATTFFRSCDLADFCVHVSEGITRLIILTVDGKVHSFYNIPFSIVRKGQTELKLNDDLTLDFERG